jgi:Ca2+-binding EF-hand superfamily protein
MILSLLGSIKLQEEELRQVKEAFNEMDTNKDGMISMEELEENIDKLHLYELTANVDLNKDQESNPAKQIMMMVD